MTLGRCCGDGDEKVPKVVQVVVEGWHWCSRKAAVGAVVTSRWQQEPVV